jgi:hypothetical protein
VRFAGAKQYSVGTEKNAHLGVERYDVSKLSSNGLKIHTPTHNYIIHAYSHTHSCMETCTNTHKAVLPSLQFYCPYFQLPVL